MIVRAGEERNWPGVEITHYKDEVGTWVGVSRRVLFSSDNSKFETRIFEIQPGGYTTFEKHEHEHCVLILRGTGKCRLGNEEFDLQPEDLVTVKPWVPHQFSADENCGMTILCIVDKVRDRPVPLRNGDEENTS